MKGDENSSVKSTSQRVFSFLRKTLHDTRKKRLYVQLSIYSRGTSSSPALIWSMRSWGSEPSTVHPTDWAVPRISRIVPERSRAPDRGRIVRAQLMMSSMVMLPLCWTRSRRLDDIKELHTYCSWPSFCLGWAPWGPWWWWKKQMGQQRPILQAYKVKKHVRALWDKSYAGESTSLADPDMENKGHRPAVWAYKSLLEDSIFTW